MNTKRGSNREIETIKKMGFPGLFFDRLGFY